MYNRNILIADDEVSFLSVYKNIFSTKCTEENNFIIQTFYNGRNLLTYLKNEYDMGNRIPLAILDIKMPVMDGMETASEVRKIDPDVFILFVTAYSDISINRLRENLKKDIYYINKPFDKENFFYLVDTLVKNWNRNFELKEKDQFNTSLLVNSPEPIIVINSDTSIKYVNPALEELTGFSAKEVIGLKTPYPWWSEEKLEAIEKNFQGSINKGLKKREELFQKKNGESFWVEVTCNPVKSNGDLTYYLINWVDITERKKGEQKLRKAHDDLEKRVEERTSELLIIKNALQESLEKYRVLFEVFPLGIAITDNEGNILECNKAWETIYSIDCKKHIGRSIYDEEWKIIRPDGNTMTIMEYAGVRALRENQIVRQIEGGVIKDNNEITWVSVTAAPIPLKKYGVAITCEDITQKMALQAEALRMSRLASIGELAAGVAHEINNPVNGIINCAEMLINKRDRTGIKKISAMIIEEGERIAHIVRSLLSFSMPQDEEKIPVKINEILNNTLTLIKVSVSKDDIKLIINIPEDLPPVNVRPRQIEQVFLNLINNAKYALNKKYPFPDENKILEIKGKKITVHGKKYICIIFHDRGTGIGATALKKLAIPFFTTKPAGEGTGLGLSISHNIITSYGGRLIFDSIEGEFTKVIIELPEGEYNDGR